MALPTQIVYRIAPRTIAVDVTHDFGLFAQDRWTIGRATLMGGVRFDSFGNRFPEGALAGTFFGRTLNVPFAETDNLSWKDITPKLGAAYDLFGTGRTALKFTLNKYLEGLGTTGIGAHNVSESPHPINRISGINVNSNRTWNDNTVRSRRSALWQLPAGLRSEQLRRRRRVRRPLERGDLGQPGRWHHVRPGPPDRLGQTRPQLGVHRRACSTS